jgi:type III secretion system HrpE/YscL family protein
MTGVRWHAAPLRLDCSVRLLKRCDVERIEAAEVVFAEARDALRAAEALKDEALRTAREAGWREGFSAGNLDGVRAGRDAWAKEIVERRLSDARLFRSIRDDVADLVMSCLKSLLSELEDGERFVRLTARVLDLASQSRRIRLHVAPSRRAHALAMVSAAGERPLQSDIEVLEDPALGPDDCLLLTESGVLDGRLLVRLHCIEDLLAQRLSDLERKG